MSAAVATTVAVGFVWLGMVLAISFLEAPIKFRAPGVTLPLGLGIGRLVFRALNIIECIFAVVVVLMVLVGRPGAVAITAFVVAVVVLVAQLLFVRPRLTRRSNAVLAGQGADQRSHAHIAYVVLELIKVVALAVGGVVLMSGPVG